MVAHRAGVAHGRLIPENVMLTDLGAVKLIGFVVDGVLHGAADPGPHDPGGDVRNLVALLYAALTGRWPGSPASAVPEAPRDGGDACCAPARSAPACPDPSTRCATRCSTGRCPATGDEAGTAEQATALTVLRRLGEFLGETVTGADVDDRTAVLDVRSVREALSGDPEATQAMRFGGTSAVRPTRAPGIEAPVQAPAQARSTAPAQTHRPVAGGRAPRCRPRGRRRSSPSTPRTTRPSRARCVPGWAPARFPPTGDPTRSATPGPSRRTARARSGPAAPGCAGGWPSA